MRSTRILSLVCLLVFLAACGGGRAPAPRSAPGGTAPAATVERFLRLAADKNYAEMGWVFGTREGPILQRDPVPQVERRMYALATVLEHQRFVITSENQIPGRGGEAVQLNVQLTNRRGRTANVPFVTVRSGDRWFVEVVDVERLTRSR